MLSPFADDRSLFRIVHAAQQAPSVLNTQPWSFWVRADDRIELRANTGQADDRHPSRWLTVTDPSARELAISCGAALFNLRMAIRVTGHDAVTWLLPDPDGDPTLLASVEVVTGRVRRPTADEQELYEAIPRRHTYRWPFSPRRVRANVLTALISAAAKERGWLRVLFPFQAASWLRVAAHAESKFSHDEPYLAELRRCRRPQTAHSRWPCTRRSGTSASAGPAVARLRSSSPIPSCCHWPRPMTGRWTGCGRARPCSAPC
jgi:nitroreductase